jgi:hypothetical protein
VNLVAGWNLLEGEPSALAAQVAHAVHAQVALVGCANDVERRVQLQHLCRRHVEESVQQELQNQMQRHTRQWCTLTYLNYRQAGTYPLVREEQARHREDRRHSTTRANREHCNKCHQVGIISAQFRPPAHLQRGLPAPFPRSFDTSALSADDVMAEVKYSAMNFSIDSSCGPRLKL